MSSLVSIKCWRFFCEISGAWRITRDEITMRRLVEDRLPLVTNLAALRYEISSSELVRATARKLSSVWPVVQKQLPLIG
jgi:hypothetical protein